MLDIQIEAEPSVRSPFDTEHLKTDLKGRSVRSGAVTMSSQGALFILHTASVVIMARLLTPEDFGLIAMVTAITAFANIFKELGLSSATIQKSEITHKQVSGLFWINTIVGLLLMLIIAALAPTIGWFYKKPELIAVTLALSVTFPVTSLGTQHSALLNRQMRFGSLALIRITALLASVIAGILVALCGGRYWALVASSLTMAAWGTMGAWVAVGHFRPRWGIRNRGIRELVRFGVNITAFDIVNYFHRNLDNVLIGRVWGAQQLGLYSRAYALLMLPIANLRGPLNAVAFPTMSRLQNNPERFRSYYTKYCSLLAFISMPLVAFLFISSDEIIKLLLGSQWLDASGLFGILALAAFIQPVAGLRGLVLLSYGQGGRYFRWGLYNAIATVIAFACGLPWGAKGVAAAYAIVTYLILHPSLMYVFKNTPVKVVDFYRAIARPCIASIVMGGMGLVMKELVQTFSDFLTLSITGTCCVLIYLGIFCLLPGGKKNLQNIWAYLLLMRRGRAPAI